MARNQSFTVLLQLPHAIALQYNILFLLSGFIQHTGSLKPYLISGNSSGYKCVKICSTTEEKKEIST